eukprot:PhM_4_TR10622/c0_g1_i1/m.80672/K11789/VPRBP, DCAF1; HIV-1 Vpr-binding protein
MSHNASEESSDASSDTISSSSGGFSFYSNLHASSDSDDGIASSQQSHVRQVIDLIDDFIPIIFGDQHVNQRVRILGKIAKVLFDLRAEVRREFREYLAVESSHPEYRHLCSMMDDEDREEFTDYLYRVALSTNNGTSEPSSPEYAPSSPPLSDEEFLALYVLMLMAEGDAIDIDNEEWANVAEAIGKRDPQDVRDTRTSLQLCILSFIETEHPEAHRTATASRIKLEWLFKRLSRYVSVASSPVKKRGRDDIDDDDDDDKHQAEAAPIPTENTSTVTSTTFRSALPSLRDVKRVVRGPDWCWGDQDGGEANPPHVGDVVAVDVENSRVCVLWPNSARYFRYTVSPTCHEVEPYDGDEDNDGLPSFEDLGAHHSLPTMRPRDVAVHIEETHALLTLISALGPFDKEAGHALSNQHYQCVLMTLLSHASDETVSMTFHTIRALTVIPRFGEEMLVRVTVPTLTAAMKHSSHLVHLDGVRLVSHILKQNLLGTMLGYSAGDTQQQHVVELLSAIFDFLSNPIGLMRIEAAVALNYALHYPLVVAAIDDGRLLSSSKLIRALLGCVSDDPSGSESQQPPASAPAAAAENQAEPAAADQVNAADVSEPVPLPPAPALAPRAGGSARPTASAHVEPEKAKVFINAINTLLTMHYILTTKAMWRSVRRLQGLAPHTAWDALHGNRLTQFMEIIEDMCSDPDHVLEAASLLRREHQRAAVAILECDAHVALLKLMLESRVTEIIHVAGSTLVRLAFAPFTRPAIAQCNVRRAYSVTTGMGVVLQALTPRYSLQAPEKIVAVGLQLLLRLLQRPADPPASVVEGGESGGGGALLDETPPPLHLDLPEDTATPPHGPVPENTEEENAREPSATTSVIVPLFRAHDGIRVLWGLLDDLSRTDETSLTDLGAARSLLQIFFELSSLSRDVVNVLSGLNIQGQLTLLRDKSHLEPVYPLITKLTQRYHVTLSVSDDPRFSRRERQEIALRTSIRVDKNEVADLIYDYLMSEGYHEAAEALKVERGVAPTTTATAAPTTQGTVSLTQLLEDHVRSQHTRCTAPISTLPTCSLLNPHCCPSTHNTQTNLARNVAIRSQLSACGVSSVVAKWHDKETSYSHYGPYANVTPNSDEGDCSSVCFMSSMSGLLVGTTRGHLLSVGSDGMRSSVELEVSDDVDVDPDCEITFLRESRLRPLIAAGFHEEFVLIKSAPFNSNTHFKIRRATSGDFANVCDNLFLATRPRNDHSSFGTLGPITLLYDIESEQLLNWYQDPVGRKDTQFSFLSQYWKNNFASFSWDDNLLLTSDALLWDRRMQPTRPLHRYDKLTSHSCSSFHPNGCHVIVDIGIWDLRTHRLLRSSNTLADCSVRAPRAGASILYAHNARGAKVVDATNYRVLYTLPVEEQQIASFSYTRHVDEFMAVVWQTLQFHGQDCSVLRRGEPQPTAISLLDDDEENRRPADHIVDDHDDDDDEDDDDDMYGDEDEDEDDDAVADFLNDEEEEEEESSSGGSSSSSDNGNQNENSQNNTNPTNTAVVSTAATGGGAEAGGMPTTNQNSNENNDDDDDARHAAEIAAFYAGYESSDLASSSSSVSNQRGTRSRAGQHRRRQTRDNQNGHSDGQTHNFGDVVVVPRNEDST